MHYNHCQTAISHYQNEFFRRINQPLTTHSRLFRRRRLVPPQSPPTFAVPKRQTDHGAQRNNSFQRNLKGHETPARVSLSIPRYANKLTSKFISRTACKAEKSYRTFATRFNRKRFKLEKCNEKRFKYFRYKLWKLKKIATFALPKGTKRCNWNDNGLKNNPHCYFKWK